MQYNPYDKNREWSIPPQQAYNNSYPGYTNPYPGMYINQPPGAPQALQARQAVERRAQSKTPSPARMPKAKALALVGLFKKSLVVMSLAAFASFSGLVAYHQINSSSSQQSTTSTTSSSQQHNNSFFNQQGENNLGTSTSTSTATSNGSTATPTTSSGSTSGSNTNPSSAPVSGSHTS